jgi:ribosomal protein S18 acetylase RimI-like enzyme
MLATVSEFRGRGIATKLVEMAIDSMKSRGADEVRLSRSTISVLSSNCCQVVLETEVTNEASLRLYERLGFLRSKRLHRYYLNGNTAFRLVLYLKEGASNKMPIDPYADPAQSNAPPQNDDVASKSQAT